MFMYVCVLYVCDPNYTYADEEGDNENNGDGTDCVVKNIYMCVFVSTCVFCVYVCMCVYIMISEQKPTDSSPPIHHTDMDGDGGEEEEEEEDYGDEDDYGGSDDDDTSWKVRIGLVGYLRYYTWIFTILHLT